MYDIFFNATSETLYLVMELVEGISLMDYVQENKRALEGGLPEAEAKRIANQLVEALIYLH